MPYELVDVRAQCAGQRAPSIGGYESFLDSGASVGGGSNYSSAAEESYAQLDEMVAGDEEQNFHMHPTEW